MSLKFAIILSGAGNKDGSEIHESVSAMLAVCQVGGVYACFAPDIDFAEVDYLSGQPTGKTRNVLAESARIARGDIQNVTELDSGDFDCLIIPGGLGAVKNLSDFYAKGVPFTVNPDVARVITDFHAAGKPIVALCIAPMLIPAVIKGAKVTLGQDENMNRFVATMGGVAENVANATDVVVDKDNKVISNPCYMMAQNLAEVAHGALNAIKAATMLIG